MVTIADVQDNVRQIYRPKRKISRLILLGRPLICPFHTLIEFVPPGSSVLDVGCGSGLFLNLLRRLERIKSGIGFDASEKAITVANAAWKEATSDVEGGFRHLSVEGVWPEGKFDVVSMIDVMHHIDPRKQQDALIAAASRVTPGGRLIYKDIGHRPRWRAWANRLHDLLLARQWVNYVPAERIVKWAEGCGMRLEHKATINMFWYGHELLIFRMVANPVNAHPS